MESRVQDAESPLDDRSCLYAEPWFHNLWKIPSSYVPFLYHAIFNWSRHVLKEMLQDEPYNVDQG